MIQGGYQIKDSSFREDWVKIGKSSRPVDVRSKDIWTFKNSEQ